MNISRSGAMTAACLLSGILSTAGMIGVATATSARAQNAPDLRLCRSIDYAFEDRERDYYAFYAFDRHYDAPKEMRAACEGATEPQSAQITQLAPVRTTPR